MANFGSSLAKFAGAGLLQYGQFKYQEQLDAMREANLAKREQARMDQADRHHKEGMAFQRDQLTAQGEKVDKQLAMTERQIQANAAEANRRLDLMGQQIGNDQRQFEMGLEYKQVDGLNSAFDAVDQDYKAVEELVMKSRLEASSSGMLPDDQLALHNAKLDAMLAEAQKKRLTGYAGLFKSNPQLAQRSNRWGGQEHQLWQASESAYLKSLQETAAVPSPGGVPGATGGATEPPPSRGRGLLLSGDLRQAAGHVLGGMAPPPEPAPAPPPAPIASPREWEKNPLYQSFANGR